MTINQIRKLFPILNRKVYGKRLIYFDNACTVLKPKPVIDAILNYYQNIGACAGGRSNHVLSQETDEICEKARGKVRDFIRAESSKEIIFTKNTTEGINLIAKSFPFSKPKNEVITTNLEHHSNLLPFYEEEKGGRIKLRIFEMERDGSIDLNKLEKMVSSRTGLISISHASNVLGNVLPIKEIIRIAHKKNVAVLVDDAQYVGTHQEDVRKEDIDFLVFSGHKLGGPTGIGVLYGKEKFLKRLANFNVGGGTVERVILKKKGVEVKYLPDFRRFEAGIQNYAGMAGLEAAINFIQKIGYPKISNHVSSVNSYLLSCLRQFPEVKVLKPKEGDSLGTITSFVFKSGKRFPQDFNIFLNHDFKDYVIAVRCGHHCAMPLHQVLKTSFSVRAYFYVYNTKQEVDIFLEALRKFLG